MIDQYLLFLAKVLTFFIPVMIIIAAASKHKSKDKPKPSIDILNQKFLNHSYDTAKKLAKFKNFKKQCKELKKKVKTLNKLSNRLFVIDFKGDMQASQIETLRHEIDLILTLASETDSILLRLNSRGGTITGYGLAASQIKRLRDANLHLTISIDQVAASGGYLIASLANDIIAAPFACIGSIGVACELPNLNKLLSKHGVEYTQITAGKYKRTLSLLGKNTPEGEKKVKEDIELAHTLFQDYITQFRDLDTNEVATGETWPAVVAQTKGLVDRIETSDEFVLSNMSNHLILHVHTDAKQKLCSLLKEKLTLLIQHLE